MDKQTYKAVWTGDFVVQKAKKKKKILIMIRLKKKKSEISTYYQIPKYHEFWMPQSEFSYQSVSPF